MKAIDNKELIIAIEQLEKEKGIGKEYLLEALEIALVTAYKKNFDSAENVKVVMDKVTGEMHVYSTLEVVEIVEDTQTQINHENAKKIRKKCDIGDVIDIEIVPKDFGRIAAGTAKQVIVQKIREAERDYLFNEFNSKKGEIVSGIIQKIDEKMIVLDLGKLEAVITTKEQVETEKYLVNQKIKTYILNVEKGIKGNPQVTLSRSNPNFVKKLLELEIPEIFEGLLEIKSVSRDPGKRSKVAVYSIDPNIDPVGSCVGPKGTRIQNIIKELNGENIDVIEWSEDATTFIASALLPAEVMAVDISEADNQANVIVPDNQLSLAIGKLGQNVRLAAKLTGWKIDIKSETQFREILENQNNEETEQSGGEAIE